ncbi:MAG: prepilin-type N-terminal cleavage/methylation domain-containing protein [Spirochaetes bacterium]|nr:prepilin-type N-terminal cleavage/methylation domain-containing protein [Spirochaetota bacterium]
MNGSSSAARRGGVRSRRGFALIEVLISVTILSIVMLSVISGVLSCIYVISENGNYTRAMMIAKTKMNEFLLDKNSNLDLVDEPIPGYSGFYYSRITLPYDHPMLPFPVKKTDIIVSWKSERHRNPYKISYVYVER